MTTKKTPFNLKYSGYSVFNLGIVTKIISVSFGIFCFEMVCGFRINMNVHK